MESIPRNAIGVYQIRNTITGAVYIGSSTTSISGRWGQHRRSLQHKRHENRHLQNAWNKYGQEAFVFEIVELLMLPEAVIPREQFWIDRHMRRGRKRCYNINPKAEGPSEICKSPANRAKVSQRMRGNQFSKRASAVIAQKVSKTYPGLIAPDGTEYRNIKNLSAFCREHGLESKTMHSVANGKVPSSLGWRRIDSPPPKLMTTSFDFVSPDGIEYRNIQNLSTFCQEHKLGLTSMSQVHAGKQKHHRGWIRHGSTFVGEFNFVGPDGRIYQNIVKLAPFCRKHGLNKDSMSNVHTGRWVQYKGWRKLH